MQEASPSGKKQDTVRTPSSSTSRIKSTSTPNVDSSSNSNPPSTSQDNAQHKRKSTADDEEYEMIPNKCIKFDNAERRKEFDSLVHDFNKDVKNESNREKIFECIIKCHFNFYKPIRDYLIKNNSSVELIDDRNSKVEYHVCNICGRQFKKKLKLLINHILIKHQMKWPKEVKIDSKSDITKLINKETSKIDAALEPAEKCNNNEGNVENSHVVRKSSEAEVSTSSEDLFLLEELENCCSILNSSPSITKEMLDSQKRFIWKVKSSPDFMNNLIWEASTSKFSIIFNKHLSANEKTFLSLIITYFSNDKICSHFYRFIEVKSEDFLIDLKNQLQMDGLDTDRFVGFGYNVTEIKGSIFESTLSDLQKIKKHFGLKAESNIIINKYVHEPVKAIVEGAHEYISCDVEFLLKETYMWFKSHKGQKVSTFQLSLEDLILKSISEENKVDIWIFKLDLVFIVINNWTELKEHFKKMKNPYDRWRIHSLYDNNVNEMYLKLIYKSLILFKNFFEYLNYALVTKDQWTEKLEKIINELKALATVSSEVHEQPIAQFQNNKKKFLNSLESTIHKILKNNNSSTPVAIPLSNETIQNIILCINQSINNFKDDFSTETAEILETCIQIKFMKENE